MKDDIILESEVKFVRTGVIAETVATKGAYAEDIIVPKGTKAYATNYSLPNQQIDPIEWCAVVPDGLDGMRKGSQTICMFWETDRQARYMEDFRVGGFPFHVFLEGQPAVGTPGPLPKIDEGAVDFGVTLKMQIRVERISSRSVRLFYLFTDGAHTVVEKDETHRWNEKHRYLLPYGSLLLTLTPSEDAKTLTVEVSAKPEV